MRYKEGNSTWNHSRGLTGWHCCPGCAGGVVLIGIWFRATLPLHREWLQGMMVCGCGRCDWLCFLCWVTVWAGCLCFWVLGPGLVVSTAEIAASGRAVGFCGVVGLHNQGGPVVYLKGMDNFWLFLPSYSLVTMAAGMLRKSVSAQLPLQMRTRGRKLGVLQAEEFELTAVCGGHTICPALFWALGIQQRTNEQRLLPWRNLHLNVKRQMANNKQDKPVGWCVRS